MTIDEAVEQAAKEAEKIAYETRGYSESLSGGEIVSQDVFEWPDIARAAIRRFLECLVATEEMRIAGADPIGRCGPYETDQDEQDAAFLAWREMSRKLAEEMGK